jgi:hypothetical protein
MYDALDFMRGVEVLLKLRTGGIPWSPFGAGCAPSAWAACPTCRNQDLPPGQGRGSAANQWLNWTELDFNTVHANDFRF